MWAVTNPPSQPFYFLFSLCYVFLMIEIRNYIASDRPYLEHICSVTDRYHLETELLYTLYLHNYTDSDPSHVFVAVSDGKPVGYILCAADHALWARAMRERFLRGKREEIVRTGEESIEGYVPYLADYPAHMHIDIDPEYQRMGIGRSLMNALVDKLRAEGVKGLMLTVSPENTRAVAFYTKCGFRRIGEDVEALGLIL